MKKKLKRKRVDNSKVKQNAAVLATSGKMDWLILPDGVARFFGP